MARRSIFLILAAGLTLCVLAFLAAFRFTGHNGARVADTARTMESIRDSGTLTVLTIQSPTTYRLRNNEPDGYEVALTRALAADLGVDTEYRLYDTIDELTSALMAGEGHLAAAGLTRLERNGSSAIFGPAYKTIRPIMACNDDTGRPENIAELADKSVGVVAGTPPVSRLQQAVDNGNAMDLQIRSVSSALVLLTEVNDGTLDCAVAESHLLAQARLSYPTLRRAFAVAEEDRQLAWLVAPQADELRTHLVDWFAEAHTSGLLADLDEEYFGHLDDFDPINITTLQSRIESRLPRYEDYFRNAAGERNLDWTLLAAQGYQESYWDPTAKSPTGVRGIMMLTLPTAREVGVDNRLDPEESIYGGAVYMDRLYDRLPESVTGRDRLWMAMAAYNVGYGHLLDARRLAERQGLNKNKWRDIDDMLPLLTKKQYYSTVRHGYARGYEPVSYVRRIRRFDDVLTENVEDPEQPPMVIPTAPLPEPDETIQ